MLPLPALAAAAAPANAVVALPSRSGALPSANTNDRLGSLLQLIESRHAGAHQQMVRDLAGIAGSNPTPAAMLRLQAAVGQFGVRVQLSVRLAEELSRSVQTLTQRS